MKKTRELEEPNFLVVDFNLNKMIRIINILKLLKRFQIEFIRILIL